MSDLLGNILAELGNSSAMELCAVILAVGYLLLAVRQNIACWYAAFISTALFLLIFWQHKLYMESGLQIYYLAMAVYGWYQWKNSAETTQSKTRISTWSLQKHIVAISLILLGTLVSGSLLKDTDQRFPYLDSFTTWSAVVTTYMVTRKVLENWLYWLVIDSASIYLYLDRELYFTALLFAAYLVIVCVGYYSWRVEYLGLNDAESSDVASQAGT